MKSSEQGGRGGRKEIARLIGCPLEEDTLEEVSSHQAPKRLLLLSPLVPPPPSSPLSLPPLSSYSHPTHPLLPPRYFPPPCAPAPPVLSPSLFTHLPSPTFPTPPLHNPFPLLHNTCPPLPSPPLFPFPLQSLTPSSAAPTGPRTRCPLAQPHAPLHPGTDALRCGGEEREGGGECGNDRRGGIRASDEHRGSGSGGWGIAGKRLPPPPLSLPHH